MEIKSGALDILETLLDGKYHSVYELNEKHGWKSTSRISDLILKKGCTIDKKKVEEGKPELKYRLIYAPEELLKDAGIKTVKSSRFFDVQMSLL